jgi:hypothetical protein
VADVDVVVVDDYDYYINLVAAVIIITALMMIMMPSNCIEFGFVYVRLEANLF